MDLADLVADYRASLNDAASVFLPPPEEEGADPDTAFLRHLRTAARDLALSKRPRTLVGELSLVAGQSAYGTVPEDLLLPKVGFWSARFIAPWNLPRAPMPVLTLVEQGGQRYLHLRPSPTAEQIHVFGASYGYYYLADHVLTEETVTVSMRDRGLLILRAQAEAMRELAFRNYTKPVSLRGGSGAMGGMPRNSTAAALYQALLAEFERAR